MEMILLDWTRLGKAYCLAGVVIDGSTLHIVRPMPLKYRTPEAPIVGWPPYLLVGHQRWDLFELIKPEAANLTPPHFEDVWVQSLRPRRTTATPAQRRAILAATAVTTSDALFGAPLTATHGAAFLPAGSGRCSLATWIMPADRIRFGGSWRVDMLEPDFRVTLPVGELGERTLPVKDHHLLLRAAYAGGQLEQQVEFLNTLVSTMGEKVAVRLGLSRPFSVQDANAPERCWLMADGFFSLTDPQP